MRITLALTLARALWAFALPPRAGRFPSSAALPAASIVPRVFGEPGRGSPLSMMGGKEEPDTGAAWNRMRVADLKAACKARGLKSSGRKDELVGRLEEAGDAPLEVKAAVKRERAGEDDVDAPLTPKRPRSSKKAAAGKREGGGGGADAELPAGLIAKARRIRDVLFDLYPDPPVPLNHVDVYTLLVAVTLSAQTTDGKVNAVTDELFQVARTPEAMVALGEDEILRIIRPVGLAPGKAKRLHQAAQMLIDRHGGRVPDTFEELEALPGVGHKTASVVMSQFFKYPAFPVDTHIHRLSNRWGLSDSDKVTVVEERLKRLFAQEDWEDLHLQMIYFGREHCPAKQHDPAKCPICSWAGEAAAASAPGTPLPRTPGTPGSNYKERKGIITYSARKLELEEFHRTVDK